MHNVVRFNAEFKTLLATESSYSVLKKRMNCVLTNSHSVADAAQVINNVVHSGGDRVSDITVVDVEESNVVRNLIIEISAWPKKRVGSQQAYIVRNANS